MHTGTMRHLTIRNVPDDLHEALTREKERRSTSLNQTVIDLLGQRLGVGSKRSNGLAKLAGDWSEDELREFETAVAPLEEIDEEMWR